jgi:hypothetical protein
MSTKNRKSRVLYIIILLVIIYYFRVNLGIISINAFLFMDSLLQVSPGFPPVVMWFVLGALVGLVYGSFVAWKKYRLDYKLNLIPVALLGLFIFFLMMVNQPISSQPVVSEVNTELAHRFVTVSASSRMPDYKNNTYGENNLVDMNDNTSWVENGSYAGVGGRIEFNFQEMPMQPVRDLKCVGFRMKNGFCKSNKLWNDYNRVRMFYVYHKDNLVETQTAGDFYNQWENIAIKPLAVEAGDVISIRISSVYPGRRKSAKTAITELVPVVEYRERR